MPVAADRLVAGRLALGHLEECPHIGRRVGAVKDDRVKAVEAQAKGGKLGLRFLGELESLRPVVVANRPLSAKVANAVATAAIEEGLARVTPTDLEGDIPRIMWQPVYRPVVAG